MFDFPRIIGLYSPCPGSGKSTVAARLQQKGYVLIPMAGTLKTMIRTLIIDLGYDSAEANEWMNTRKQEIIPEIGFSFRDVATRAGTEGFRDLFGPDFWLKVWTARYSQVWASMGDHIRIVVDDLRFANEPDLLTRIESSAEIWRIERPGLKVPEAVLQHRSEGGLEGYSFHRHITNDGSFAELFDKVDAALGAVPA